MSKKSFDQGKMNWTAPKQFGPGQNSFGLIERQGIILFVSRRRHSFYSPMLL
jgi:hypothetical protein